MINAHGLWLLIKNMEKIGLKNRDRRRKKADILKYLNIKIKEKTLKNKHIPLDCEEILIALSITAATNSMAEVALSKLSQLEGVQAHSTHILGRNDEQSLRKLGIDVTSDQVFPTENLYYNQ